MAVGIIAEFNPFHNGHKYLIDQARRYAADNAVAVVMSGSWVQRGGIAISDKWARTRAALANGADLVIELPVCYSMNTAQKFAYGAIATLAATGIVDALAFGSETADTLRLITAAELLVNEPPEASEAIKKAVADGISYASARSKALDCYIPEGFPTSPNDILAIEYIRAMLELDADFKLHAIKRTGAEHDSSAVSNKFASASYIRQLLLNGDNAADFIPSYDMPIYNPTVLDTALIACFRSCGADYLRQINDVSEGLENRFINAAMCFSTADELCAAVKSKRYTLSRIRRIAWSALIGLDSDTAACDPSYIRVLGMNKIGMTLLKRMKKNALLPVIIKAADYAGDKIFSLNCRAEDIFSLAAPMPELRRGGRDFHVSPVILS